MPSILSLDEFKDLLDRFGGDLSAWPAARRTDAKDLLDRSADARGLLDEAVSLDASLGTMPKAPAGLSDRIVAAALKASPPRKG